ncbi:MAG: nicotinate phosphoribosyltransferase [Litorilinea sp.]
MDNQLPPAPGILLTDQYQLSMAQLYFRMGLHERPVHFDHFFRRYPDYGSHQAGYCINAGFEPFARWMGQTRFEAHDMEYLRGQRDSVGKRVFQDDFLDWLRVHGDFSALTLWAVPEGRVVHANAPLTMVQGPLAMAQILETPLLNFLNYPTLIATKASRLNESGRGRPILEFGLRRAQGEGGNAGARAALIGGAAFTSNVAVSRQMGLAPKGTHAHSMVQLFMTLGMGELGAFEAYADVYPDDCLLLVDTVNTLESGVPNAIRVFEKLRRSGHKPLGIRLDSGDLAYLSILAAKMLDDAGFADTSIVLSSDLDELVIWQIITQISIEAPRYGVDADHLINRLIYGVGTRLITSWGEPALGGVFKLVAVETDGQWDSAIKLSDTPAKTPNPGIKQIWRIYDQRGNATADLLTLHDEDPRTWDVVELRHPADHTKQRALPAAHISDMEPLLVKAIEQGKPVADFPPLEELRAHRTADIERLDPGIRRLVNPHEYHVSLTPDLWDLKQRLISAARGGE